MPTEENKNNGRFAKGTSGNPAGRPPGSRNRAALLMEALLEDEAEQICRKAVDLALKDNTRALQLCLDRLMPPPKDRVVSFDLPKLQSLDDIPQGGEQYPDCDQRRKYFAAGRRDTLPGPDRLRRRSDHRGYPATSRKTGGGTFT